MSHEKKSFLMGVIVGGLIGGVTALLLAPKSGDKMRKDLVKRYNEVSKKTQKMVNGMADQAMHLVDKAKEIAEEAKDAAQSILDEIK